MAGMSKYDLKPLIAPNLDRHMVFPLLESIQEREIYPNEQILKAKIELLNNTNMVDYAIDIHKSLYHTHDVPQDMMDRRVEVVARLKSLEEAAAQLVTFLQNLNVVQELRADKQYNLQMLNDRYQIGLEQIKALYQYAKFQFECGNYSGATDYLYQYRALCTNAERSLSALWGKLAAKILMHNWDIALEELNRLKEIIDSKNFTSSLNQSFCIVFVNFDFDGAQKKMKECEDVILNDPFLGKRVEESNYTVVPLKDEFIENARPFIFKTYCRIHERIDMRTTSNVPTTEPFVQHMDEPNIPITPYLTTLPTNPPQPDTPPSHNSTPIPRQTDTHPSHSSTPIPTLAQTQSHAQTIDSHTPIPINNLSQTMPTHPRVTRAKAGIFKPLERMNFHVTTTSPLPRSHVHALY
nr:eukaryotic translation initiation factor 3 subunit E [Tanacetum cinerariifolium]